MKEKNRCHWCIGDPLYEAYHDQEWGVPVKDDQQLFEFLILETFQAGLSWLTILRKRENFRAAFDNFNFISISKYEKQKIISLMNNSGIIRNKAKIEAAVSNARAYIAVRQEHGSFSQYLWDFVGHEPVQNQLLNSADAPSSSELSALISRNLKKKGFKFVGPTVVYAYMQATGMVNDHQVKCFRYQEVQKK